MRNLYGSLYRIAGLGLLSALMTGCLLGVSTGDVMVREGVREYESFALIGLESPADSVFRTIYQETFPGTEFAERQAVLDLFPGDHDFSRGLGDEIRGKIQSSLGVHAIMIVFWEDSGLGGTLDWRMEIIDAETGATTGTVVAHVRKEPMARGVEFNELERNGFEALISTLEDRLNR